MMNERAETRNERPIHPTWSHIEMLNQQGAPSPMHVYPSKFYPSSLLRRFVARFQTRPVVETIAVVPDDGRLET